MSSSSRILPYKANYPDVLSEYVAEIKQAIRQGKHHDQRREFLLNYLRLAYGVEVNEIEIEQKIKVANVKGFIDALYKYIIFEVKTDIDSERPAAMTELRKYFAAQKTPSEYLGLVTDGLRFELYQLEGASIEQISKFTIDENDVLGSFRYLDNILFSAKKTTPRSIDITTRYGPDSAVFRKCNNILTELLGSVKTVPSVKVKFSEWNSLLSRVYGEPIGDQILFVRHTYLTMLSRLLVLNALFPKITMSKTLYRGLLTGQFFAKHNLPNLAEPDFFSWALGTTAEDDFIGFLSRLDTYLRPYKFDDIDEDILKEIYQELVDTTSRHSLGEYYTPDWIADLALESIKYKSGTVLDPACGSGSFLLATIRRLRKQGLAGSKLLNKAMTTVSGIDVHPLAVIMTKANLLLSLAKEIKEAVHEVYLPVYMADTLLVAEDKKKRSIAIQASAEESFHIPSEAAERGDDIDRLIDKLASVSQIAVKDSKTMATVWSAFESRYLKASDDHEKFLWKQNFKLYVKLIKQNKDTVWAFILKNACRPAYLRRQKVDYILGNPPWLAYRYIKDKAYKAVVKDLTLHNGLLDRTQVKLFTQLDTSTLFFVYCQKYFLKEGGTIGFVLPKTTILPAKQHAKFQELGFSQIHDFSGVSPLFNVRSVLLISNPKTKVRTKIPTTLYRGRLSSKNLKWETAKKFLSTEEKNTDFLDSNQQLSPYFHLFQQGATIVPRSFWFVQQDKNAAKHEKIPHLETSDEALDEAKNPWKIKIQGRIEKELIFETILAKGLLPFGITRTESIFLPIIRKKKSYSLADSVVLTEKGFENAALWLAGTEKLWETHRQTNDRSLLQRLNYNQTLIRQDITAEHVVIYNTSGTNLASALFQRSTVSKNTGLLTNGFFADAKTYYYYVMTEQEGHYLVACLNSDIVNLAIKQYQPQGLYGERDIHRRPFEVCAIPKFDLKNPVHIQLAELGGKCKEELESLLPQFAGRLGQKRLDVRKLFAGELNKINKLVVLLLEESGQDTESLIPEANRIKNGDLFE
ncbi:MAG: N-6 DNA methylase [candidate division Zixibacteria bacterium]|nr:N-6 DNA methylase [candidate division Zixibacteria bacterium]